MRGCELLVVVASQKREERPLPATVGRRRLIFVDRSRKRVFAFNRLNPSTTCCAHRDTNGDLSYSLLETFPTFMTVQDMMRSGNSRFQRGLEKPRQPWCVASAWQRKQSSPSRPSSHDNIFFGITQRSTFDDTHES